VDQVVTDEKALSGKYDLIVDLRGKWKGLFYAFKHRPLLRLDRGTVRLKNKRKGAHPHEMTTNVEIIAPLLSEPLPPLNPRLYTSEADQQAATSYLQANSLTKFAVLHTGARRVLRQWPGERFAIIAQLLHDQYGFEIIFAGDNNDTENIAAIRSQIPFPTFSIAGTLGLGAFSALVAKAGIYLGNESGPLHIASTNNIPCIGLYGPGEPTVFYPISKKSAVIHHILECNPCDQIHCVHPDNPCIKRITIEEVREKITGLLGS
jgi:heptosyltransferase-3